MMSCSVVVAAVTVVAVAVVMSNGHEEPGPGVCLPNHTEFRDDVIGEKGHIWYAIDFENNTMGFKSWLASRNELYVYMPEDTRDYYWGIEYCNLKLIKNINLTHQMFPQCVPSTGRLVGDMWMFRNSQKDLLFYSNTKPSKVMLRAKLDYHYVPIVYKEWRDSFSDKGLLFFDPSCKNLSMSGPNV